MLLLEQLNHTSTLSSGRQAIARWLVDHRDEMATVTTKRIAAETLAQAVGVIARARVVHMAAASFPLLYAQDFQFKMRRLGRLVEVCSLVEEPLFTEPILREDDCAIAISYSGTMPATIDMARM